MTVSVDPRGNYGGWKYVPTGGAVLTAELLEDVRTVAGEDGAVTMTGEFWAARDRLRALFPATEPAEEAEDVEEWTDIEDVPVGQIVIAAGMTWKWDGRHPYRLTGAGWVQESREYADRWWPFTPAPAVPAEEETKAEGGHHLHGKGDGKWYDITSGALVLDLSSPVVPAPTETGPWMHADEIPSDVTVVTDRDKRTWRYSSRTDKWTHRSHGQTRWVYGYPDHCFAPFVAAEEKDA